jgi:hypothetical protein
MSMEVASAKANDSLRQAQRIAAQPPDQWFNKTIGSLNKPYCDRFYIRKQLPVSQE